jgi:hypothetical protein
MTKREANKLVRELIDGVPCRNCNYDEAEGHITSPCPVHKAVWEQAERQLRRETRRNPKPYPAICERHCGVCDGNDHHWLYDGYGMKCKHCGSKRPVEERDMA